MLPNILDPYPRGYANPVLFRPTAALEAAGAWDPAPVVSFSTNVKHMGLQFTYTRGAAGGAFDWQVEISYVTLTALVPAGAAEWSKLPLYSAGIVAAGAETQSLVQTEYKTFEDEGSAAAQPFPWTIELDGTVARVRILARESADGVVGTPGTLQISAILI